jgi:uncharacterized protein (TIGR03083 family)
VTATDAAAFEIGTTISCRAIQPLLVVALRSQRTRLLAALRDASENRWQHPTRCERWNVQQVVLHVCGANDALCMLMTGEIPALEEDFDPRTSPHRYVELHASESTSATLQRLEASNASLFDSVDQLTAAGGDERVTSVWDGKVDWRLVAAHALWDTWIHERDILLPLGQQHGSGDDEARLVVAYTLLLACVTAGFTGVSLDREVRLGGTGGGRFRTRIDGTDVRISADAEQRGGSQGDAPIVADVLSGRGPELVEVLDIDSTLAGTLSHLREFFRTPVE